MTGTFEEESFKELNQIEIEALKSNADISKIISGTESAICTINVNGVDVRFKSFISRKLRHKMSIASKMKDDENADVVAIERFLYETLSSFCKDEPYTKATTWQYIDEQGGDCQGILTEMMRAVSESANKLKDFRGK